LGQGSGYRVRVAVGLGKQGRSALAPAPAAGGDGAPLGLLGATAVEAELMAGWDEVPGGGALLGLPGAKLTAGGG
jgi:hypothetical protein